MEKVIFGKAAAANTEYTGRFEGSCMFYAVFGILRDFWVGGHLCPGWASNRTSLLLYIFILDLTEFRSLIKPLV